MTVEIGPQLAQTVGTLGFSCILLVGFVTLVKWATRDYPENER